MEKVPISVANTKYNSYFNTSICVQLIIMRRIVLDTNCLLQTLPVRSPYHKIWTDILCGKICLCVNTEILNEYEEILAQKMTKEIARNVVEAIARLVFSFVLNKVALPLHFPTNTFIFVMVINLMAIKLIDV